MEDLPVPLKRIRKHPGDTLWIGAPHTVTSARFHDMSLQLALEQEHLIAVVTDKVVARLLRGRPLAIRAAVRLKPIGLTAQPIRLTSAPP